MALVSIEHIKKVMREQKVPYWHLTDNGGSRNAIDTNQSEDNIESSFELLETSLTEIEDNVVCINLSNRTRAEKGKGGRGMKEFDFKIKLKSSDALVGGNSQFGLLLTYIEKNNELQRKIDAAAQQAIFDERLRKLEEKEKPDYLEKLLPILERITGNNKSVSIASAGHEDESVDEKRVKAEEKMRAAIKKLLTVDKNLPDTLTRFADFAVKNPKEYKDLVSKLKFL